MTSLNKNVWGPAAWTFLHAAAAVCDDPGNLAMLLRATATSLPCPECRSHALAHLEAHPPEGVLTDRLTASEYVWKMHNETNVRTGRPTRPRSILAPLYGVDLQPPATQQRPPQAPQAPQAPQLPGSELAGGRVEPPRRTCKFYQRLM